MLWGTKFDKGSMDRLRSPAGPGQSPGRETRGAKLVFRIIEALLSSRNFEAF